MKDDPRLAIAIQRIDRKLHADCGLLSSSLLKFSAFHRADLAWIPCREFINLSRSTGNKHAQRIPPCRPRFRDHSQTVACAAQYWKSDRFTQLKIVCHLNFNGAPA